MPAHHPAPTASTAQATLARMPGWRPQRPRWPAAAGTLALTLALTLAVLWALWAPPPRHRLTPLEPPAPTWLRLLPLPATPAPPVDPEAPRRLDPALLPAPPTPPRPPALPLPALPVPRAADPQPITLAASAATAVPGAAANVPPPGTAASHPPPLRLGNDVMQRAARDSLAQTRRLAAEAGLPAERDPSEQERLASSVAQAGKPDCLGPNAGGSLLSLPWAALQALRQKCK